MALSFPEKRALQKTVSTNLAALAAGKVSFIDKRRLQKEITEAMAKLNAKVDTAPTQYDSMLRQFTDEMVGRGFMTDAGNVFISHPSIRDKIGGRVSASMDLVEGEVQTIAWKDNLQGERVDRTVFNGFDAMRDALDKVDALMGSSEGTPVNQNLADLQAGKFDSLDPLAFLGKLKEIADEINDIEPLKGPAISYIEKNSDKVTAIMESAMQEAFGKLWSAGALLESAVPGLPGQFDPFVKAAPKGITQIIVLGKEGDFHIYGDLPGGKQYRFGDKAISGQRVDEYAALIAKKLGVKVFDPNQDEDF